MGLLDMCCPKKPKMTLDYVIKWVKETDKTLKEVVDWMQEIKEMDLQKVFDDYARDEYDWSQVPEFDAKADKVENAINGNLASLDSNGNLLDSGSKVLDFATAAQGEKANTALQPVDSAVDNDFVAFNADGTLKDSGYSNSSFKASSSVDSEILNTDPTDGMSHVQTEVTQETGGEIRLYVKKGSNGALKSAIIDSDNIANLNKALTTPDSTPIYNSPNYVTSGGVYDYVSLLLRRLEECEKQTEVEYSISAECTYDGAYVLTYNGYNIFYYNNYNALQYVDYLYNLAVVGDTIVIKDNTTGNAIQTVTVVGKIIGPNRLILSSNILLEGHIGHTIGIAITHNTYSV